jgi:hypothetical protein
MKERANDLLKGSLIRTLFAIGFGALLAAPGMNAASAAAMHHGPAGPVPVTTLIQDPKVPFRYALGLRAFRDKCAECHGQWAEGVADKGPPLVHPYYRPGHHPDGAFYRAAMSGVKSHHWNFGDMPPVAGITKKDIAAIIRFVRWWQEQNGIR